MDIVVSNFAEPGDIVLFPREGAVFDKSTLLQSFARLTWADCTHVAICDGLGGLFHCTPDEGVAYQYFRDVLDGINYKAFRNEALCFRIKENYSDFAEMMDFHVGKEFLRSYISGDLMKAMSQFLGDSLDEGETFCSALIGDILSEYGIYIAKSGERPLPVDFQSEVRASRWNNVTPQHIAYYESISRSRDNEANWNECNATRKLKRLGSDILDASAGAVIELQKECSELDRLIGYEPSNVDDCLKEIEKQYWDQKHYKK